MGGGTKADSSALTFTFYTDRQTDSACPAQTRRYRVCYQADNVSERGRGREHVGLMGLSQRLPKAVATMGQTMEIRFHVLQKRNNSKAPKSFTSIICIQKEIIRSSKLPPS